MRELEIDYAFVVYLRARSNSSRDGEVGKLLGAELADPSLDRLGRRLLGGHRGTPERQQKREKPCRGDDAGGEGQSGERGRIHRKNLMIEQRDYTTVTPGSLREPEG